MRIFEPQDYVVRLNDPDNIVYKVVAVGYNFKMQKDWLRISEEQNVGYYHNNYRKATPVEIAKYRCANE